MRKIDISTFSDDLDSPGYAIRLEDLTWLICIGIISLPPDGFEGRPVLTTDMTTGDRFLRDDRGITEAIQLSEHSEAARWLRRIEALLEGAEKTIAAPLTPV
jgi:hypothetical protein